MKTIFRLRPNFLRLFSVVGSLLLLTFFSCGGNGSNGDRKPVLFKKQVYFPLVDPAHMSGGFNPFIQHQEQQEKLFKAGIEKYDIQHQGFHKSAIYHPGDLTEVLEILLKNLLADRDFEFLPEVLLEDSVRYEVTLKFRGALFHFKTSSKQQLIQMAPNLKELNRLAARFYPGHLFAVANFPDDHRSSMIFAKKTDLEQAVAEGFPCSLDQWTWKDFAWEKGVYPVVEVNRLPGEQQMKEMVLKELAESAKKGYPVPLVQPDQLYLTDMAEDGLLHIIVNGASESLNLRVGNRVHCDDDAWGVFLAYCLAKAFDGKILLEKPVRRRWKQMERTVFLKEMEKRLMGKEEDINSTESNSQ